MIVHITISGVLPLLKLTGVSTGIEGQLVSANDLSMSDEEILLCLDKLGLCTSYPARDVAFIRELTCVLADVSLLNLTRRHLDGTIDESCSSPLRFVRTLDALSNRLKLKKLDLLLTYLAEAVKILNGNDLQHRDNLRLSRLYRKHWRKYLKAKQK